MSTTSLKQPTRRISIGAKFLILVVTTLTISVSAIVVNAIILFRKDNLNNIYLSSDLLTSSKASEAKSWLDATLKRGSLIGSALLREPALAERFKYDKDIVFVAVYENSGTSFDLKKSWLNRSLASQTGLTQNEYSSLKDLLKIRFDKLESGMSEMRNLITPSGKVFLLGNIPLSQSSNGKYTTFLSIALHQKRLMEGFADTGPYSLALINDEGRVLAHKDPKKLLANENLSQLPIVKKMFASPLEREFQEFSDGKQVYLGAYAKLGIAGLGVISQVPKSIALETGDALVERSIYIALFICSAVFILAYLLVTSIVSPILRLQRATQEIAKGNFTVQVQVQSRDEMLDLANSFNTMGSEIQKKIDNLSRINEASITISSTLDPKKLLEFSVETLTDLLGCNRAVAWFKSGGAQPKAPGNLIQAKHNWFENNAISAGEIIKKMTSKDQPSRLIIGTTHLLVAPIREKSVVCGYVVLAEKKNGKEFQDEDLFVAGTVLTGVGTTFENIRLLMETADKARMEKELETAKHVQDTMFPPTELKFPGFEIQSYYTPAAECGGDWWGCVELPNDQVLLAIGDATGHGVPAAMVTATAKATCSVLHSLAQGSPTLASSPKVMLHLLNKAVYESTRGKILMTFFMAVVNTKTGEVTYATASHDPIYWYKMPAGAEPGTPGDRASLDTLSVEPGRRLGQEPKSFYQQAKIQLNPGDFILLYTDGLPEGNSPEKEEWGERKFMRSIVKHAHQSPQEIREGILESFREHIQSEPLHDDVTLAVCQWSPTDPERS